MQSRKKLGILGGMGSRAASMLFSKIINFSPAIKDQEFIEVLLHNNVAIPDRTRAIVYNEASPVKELLRSVALFDEQKIDLIIMACITSYYYLDTLQAYTSAKILNPVQLIKEHLLKHYMKTGKAGLLATTGTLNSMLFQKEFKDSGIEIITPDKDEQEELFMRAVYMENGLKSSRISPQAVDLLFQLVPRLLERGAEVIIGGCTEVQIVLQQNSLSVPYVDVMDIAAQEAVRLCYNLDEHQPLHETVNHHLS